MTKDDDPEVVARRAEFRGVLRRRLLDELGVPEEEATTWLAEAVNVRWQTAQAWLRGTTIPLGKNLHKLAKALGIAEAKLIGPMVDEAPPPAFLAFRATPEGASMSDVEAWTIRLFSWAKEPTVGIASYSRSTGRTRNGEP